MLIDDVERYVTLRRSLGFKLRKTSAHLASFAEYAASVGDVHIRRDTALEWAAATTSTTGSCYRRLLELALCARFLHAEDAGHEVPQHHMFYRSRSRPAPYIYSPDELTRLLEAARNLRRQKPSPLRRHVYVMLFGLIAATGLRMDATAKLEAIEAVVPRDLRALYKIRPIINSVFDKASFFEIGRQHGPSIVTGFARLDGYPVAVMASDPMILGGLWTAATARKVERFIDLADTFHLPVVHMVDNPGFMIGRVAEEEATIRYGSRAMTAVYQSKVPIAVVILRKVYGMGGSAPANLSRYKWRFAWPSGDWGSLPIAGGLEAAYRGELEASDDPAALLKDITARLNRVRSPFRTAEAFGVEDIIDPRDTRPLLCEFIEAAYRVLEAGPKARGYRC